MSRKNVTASSPKATPKSARHKTTTPRKSGSVPPSEPVIVEAMAPPETPPVAPPDATKSFPPDGPGAPDSSAKQLAEAEQTPAGPMIVEAMAPPEEPLVVEAMAPPEEPAGPSVDRATFEAMVRQEAYLQAERRGFRNGNPFEDWVRAESVVRAKLQADGVSVR